MLTCQLSCKCINQINTLNFPLVSWESPIASLVAQRVKCLPAMWETRVRSLGGEDLLEEEMATHSSILGLPLVAQTVKNPPAMWETRV